jgi:PAS domain S-box-containing protein
MSLSRILIVEMRQNVLIDAKALEDQGYEVRTFAPITEDKIPEDVGREVISFEPDLLIIEIRPRLRREEKWNPNPLYAGPIYRSLEPIPPSGLKAVEWLRERSNNVSVVFVESHEKEQGEIPFKNLWEQIAKTRPVAVVQDHAVEFAIALARERAQAREEAWQKEELFRTVFESTSDPVFVKDTSLRYTHVNAATAGLFLRESSDFIGRTDHDLFDKQVADHFKELEERVLQGERIEDEYSQLIGGVEFTFLYSRAPLKKPDGLITGVHGIARDVTDRSRVGLSKVTAPRVYKSAAMRECLDAAHSVAKADSIVLLLGERGSGKDFLARYIHDHSHRSGGPFFDINCAAIASNVAESELFGHEAGAYTGAEGRKKGLVEPAEGGTLFFNEIGEFTPDIQAKLLSFLETQTFTRVGGEKKIRVNARIIAATNLDLPTEIKQGRFRADFFDRLNKFPITVPPLRKRREDIHQLFQAILSELLKKLGYKDWPAIRPGVVAKLRAYHWPGNVRELHNALERSLILSGGKTVDIPSLGLDQVSDENRAEVEELPASSPGETPIPLDSVASCAWPHGKRRKRPKRPSREVLRDLLEEYINEKGWPLQALADEMKIDRTTLSKWRKQYGLAPASDPTD